MELGLSLGDASKPLGFIEKARDVSSKRRLGFCMGLSIDPNPRNEQQDADHHHDEQEAEEDGDKGKHSSNNYSTDTAATTSTIKIKRAAPDHDLIDTDHQHHRRPSTDPPIIQLDLLPNTPVVVPRHHHHALLWPSSDNGSYDAKGLDVNRLPAVEEAEDGAALSSSTPNSAASSFQMDFCIYGKGGNHHEGERASSRASDEDENGSARKKLRLSKEQSAFLEESFKEHNTLNPKQKLALAKQLSLRPRQVEVWFQNRRARTKLKQTEVDCEYLKRCCETLTEENRRLHKELQELRALTSSNPFYMQVPATTLTMCPSCERVATTSTATATTTTTTTTTKNNISTEPASSKGTGLSLSTKTRLYPFVHTQTHSHQPTAS
ncbi:homeobox-leucine zipper protein HOX11 [Ricinus communis]|uniref:Homeobox protein, putative n=1 Tax=Ricinus communis TaxID=3988 RepID=B9REK5_RICCO|nr:homeobox-leucine zipper protein HOX11 [Ricinus communis]EEF50208.1 homeobox protein, putative [Ricinus communis]|eukprot:XP_002512174.1 homeobox-leucine zipper protein HOX11 [Ricinus communis]